MEAALEGCLSLSGIKKHKEHDFFGWEPCAVNWENMKNTPHLTCCSKCHSTMQGRTGKYIFKTEEVHNITIV